MKRLLLALIALCLFASPSFAGPFGLIGRRGCSSNGCSTGSNGCNVGSSRGCSVSPAIPAPVAVPAPAPSVDAVLRQAAGLPDKSPAPLEPIPVGNSARLNRAACRAFAETPTERIVRSNRPTGLLATMQER